MNEAAGVLVEVVLLRLTPAGHLAYRVAQEQLGDRAPDAVALDAAGVTPAAAQGGTVSHSTSWRYDSGCVVLTYAVVPDPRLHLPAQPLQQVGIVCSPDPLHPSPAGVHDHHVAAHAVRHLSHLAGTDPTVAGAAVRRPDLWRALREHAATITVGGHDHSHRMVGPPSDALPVHPAVKRPGGAPRVASVS